MKDINQVMLVCRLTRDPELRSTAGGTSVCSLRVAFSSEFKDSSGEWKERPNYADVTVWGKQGENVARHMSKGRQIGVLGRLNWREWETDSGQKRQVLDIVADHVQFLGGRGDSEGGGGDSQGYTRSSGGSQPAAQDAPVSTGDEDFSSIPATGTDDDIPF